MTDAELQMLLSEGIGGKNRPLDESRLERNLEAMLEHAVDLTGQRTTIKMLESGLGTWDQFLGEVKSGETAVVVTIHEPVPRLLALSEKVQVAFIVGDYEATEIWRRYERKDNLVIPTTTPHKVIQGTLKRTEGWKTGAHREVLEEVEIDVPESDFLPVPETPILDPIGPARRRESSVYPGLLRAELRHKFFFERETRPWDYKETPPDNGVVVCFAFQPRATRT